LHRAYDLYQARLESEDQNQAVLKLSYPAKNPTSEIRLVIDLVKHVVVKRENYHDGKLTTSTEYSDFIEVASAWWPQRIVSYDDEGLVTSRTSQHIEVLPGEDFQQAIQAALPDKETGLIISSPLPSVRAAKLAVADGSAGVEDRLTLMAQASSIQRWQEMLEQLDKLETLVPRARGLTWVRIATLRLARQHEQARQMLMEQAAQLATRPAGEASTLAAHLWARAGEMLDLNERLRLLAPLQLAVQDQPPGSHARLSWMKWRAATLVRLQRVSEYNALQKEIAEAAPWDTDAQRAYAESLRDLGDLDAALDWLKQQFNRPQHSVVFAAPLRDAYATLLAQAGRAEELTAFMTEWIQTNPADAQVYQRYLHALWQEDRLDEADAVVQRWLDEGMKPEKLSPPQRERLRAAADYARGQRYQAHMSWIEPKWLEPLERVALFFLDHEYHFDIAEGILNHHRFNDSANGDRVFAIVSQRLLDQADQLDADHVAVFVRWCVHRHELDTENWRDVAKVLRQRWQDEQGEPRYSLASALLRIYETRFSPSEYLPFLRDRVARSQEEGDEQLAATQTLFLFNTLINRRWSAGDEQEALELVSQTAASDSPGRLMIQVGTLHRAVDALLQARVDLATMQLQETGHPESLTRSEFAAKIAEFQKSAQQGVASSLAALATKTEDPELARWVRLERIHLDLMLNREIKPTIDWCWQQLGQQPREEVAAHQIAAQDDQTQQQLQTLFENRLLTIASYLAARPSTPTSHTDRLVEYFTAGAALDGDKAAVWRTRLYRLLIVLDRTDDLARHLRVWIRTDPVPTSWQNLLARLLAERGQIDEAIALMETVEKNSLLTAEDYRVLAGWYLVSDQRQQFDRSSKAAFLAMGERAIHRWLRQQHQRWTKAAAPPTELDEKVLLAFEALFEKSTRPERYLDDLRDHY
ncbi:MAG: hypothetical protein MI861_05585, partial [Pirellulales bacterium]|nr:hypothetical protein [Pirellulales bacterium]